MKVLVDSSVWIGYFRSGEWGEIVDTLIEENLLVINDLILTELIPFLQVQNQQRVIQLLKTIERLPLQINWEELIVMQTSAIQKGLNGVGIPDLILAQNAIQRDVHIFSSDKHCALLKQVTALKLYPID